MMIDARRRGTWSPKTQDEGVWVPGIVGLAAVERFLPKGSPRWERKDLLVRLCGRSAVRNLNIRGTLDVSILPVRRSIAAGSIVLDGLAASLMKGQLS